MTVSRQLLVWVVAAVAALLFLIGIVIRQHREEESLTFLDGDPHAGAHLFQEKGCSHCHSALGAAARRGSDLSFQRASGSSLNQLVTEMWNHAPLMWARMEAEGVTYPAFSAKDMANLFAYLYVLCYVDEPGNRERGRALFSQKGCIRCHSMDGAGGAVGPDLRALGTLDTPIYWAQAMWNHAPKMEAHLREMQMSWPRFVGDEMNDLLAFIREGRAGPRREAELLPADERRGWELFRKKGCLSCHSARGEGGTTGPDLGSGKPLPSTVTRVAAQMWNHSPQMWAAMKGKNIERPTFEGKEMADVIAFLYSLRYCELGGSPLIGQALFQQRKCGQCHGTDGLGDKHGPKLRGRGRLLTPVTLAQALWSHGPRMYQRSRELGLGWPGLKESDLQHLLAFLNAS